VVQLGLTYRTILQKHENVRATSNEMMCKTTDSQTIKLKKKDSECVIEIVSQQQIASYYHSLSVGCLWSRCLWRYRSFIKSNMLVVASPRLSPSVWYAIRFLFLDLTCFMAETVLQTSSAFLCESGQFGKPTFAD